MAKQIGNIDEEGLINSLDRDGMTCIRAIFEFIGNSIDGECANFIIVITDDKILFIDDGKGMSLEI